MYGVNGMGERKSFLWWMAGMGWGKKVVFMEDGGDGMGEESRFRVSWCERDGGKKVCRLN